MSTTANTFRADHASALKGRVNVALQWAVVGSIMVAAVAHIPVIAPHLEEAPYMGVLFIALTAVCLSLGAVIAVRSSTWAYQSAAVVCGAAVLAYAATRLVAFPQLADDVGNWFEPLGVVSVLSESLVVVLAVAAVRRRRT
ncbi:hypothetical protein [Nocardioides marmorisolisilvae]|uniref:Uncharacterized protein n=1 Tax=Nocardioides marmorisolisilvae TaxID=1542737 RepID=A0A3N0DWF2_9ACTN|nr:hypothetical protein [Nocardioides marmorisolisilvae]RNL79944.1 hypothetical protein EFL95_13535 [Nocardioides marmorisolisilvae]